MTFTFSLLAIALLVGIAYVASSRKKTAVAQVSWEELIAKLEPVPVHGIARVAVDYLQPGKGQIAIEPAEMWSLIGEWEGLRKMQINAEVLISLAGMAQQWNFNEAVIVAERMRRDGLALRQAAQRVELALIFGYDRVKAPFSIQEVASAYHLMRERLLALYETSHAGRYPELAAAL